MDPLLDRPLPRSLGLCTGMSAWANTHLVNEAGSVGQALVVRTGNGETWGWVDDLIVVVMSAWKWYWLLVMIIFEDYWCVMSWWLLLFVIICISYDRCTYQSFLLLSLLSLSLLSLLSYHQQLNIDMIMAIEFGSAGCNQSMGSVMATFCRASRLGQARISSFRKLATLILSYILPEPHKDIWLGRGIAGIAIKHAPKHQKITRMVVIFSGDDHPWLGHLNFET